MVEGPIPSEPTDIDFGISSAYHQLVINTSPKSSAINLRRKGFSYSEISLKLKIPRSTISTWLANIKLSEEHKYRLTKKQEVNRKLGSIALKNNRIKKTNLIINNAINEVGKLKNKDLWLIGSILYWAEGSKQKEYDPSKGVIFSNSDPVMLQVFLKWLKKCTKINDEEIVFEIYIHETYKRTKNDLGTYWSKVTKFPIEKFNKVYFKKNKVHSYRKNRGPQYNGVLRISVKRSTDLNRKITGWIKGISKEFIY